MPLEAPTDEKCLEHDFEALSGFAERRMKARALDITSGADNVGLFRNSLESTMAHTTLRQPPRDAGGKELTVVAGYLDKLIPNALADRVGDRHFIAMNTTLFVAAQEFAMFCFLQASFFPELGNPSLEQSPSPIDERVPGLGLLD